MKKIIFKYVLTCMCVTLFILKAPCQNIINSAALNTGIAQADTSEYNSAIPVNNAEDYRNAINIGAVRNFIKEFKDAKNVSWLKAKDGGFIAKFVSDSIQTMAAYNRFGTWTYSLKRYSENRMPSDLRTIVKSSFFDYSIIEVTEIILPMDDGNITYRVLIKYATNFKILQISSMEMKIISDYSQP